MTKTTRSLTFLSLLCACANPYRANFASTIDRIPRAVQPRLIPFDGTPKLYRSDNLDGDKLALFENGYVLVGVSRFNGPQVDTKLAIEQAKAVGAEIVMVETKYARTVTETIPYTVYSGDQYTSIRDRGVARREDGKTVQIDNQTEIRTGGTYETVFVPLQKDYFDQGATFWMKTRPSVFGAFVRDLKEEERQKIQSNRGLVVWVVVKDSPAFDADILRGDIITKWNGEPVPAAEVFIERLSSQNGTTARLSILRNGKPKEIQVGLK